MRLTYYENEMLDGKYGPAVQRAMDLLVRYGDMVGAEDLVETDCVSAGIRLDKPYFQGDKAFDAYFSEFHLDSRDVVDIPRVRANSCTILQQMDPQRWEYLRVSPEAHDYAVKIENSCHQIGLCPTYTCAPYLVGYVPLMGEHCAWMESSAVPICNSIFGARTNTEGFESAGAAMMTGRIPNWGYHLPENRLGQYLVQVEFPVESVMDWGLLGYSTGWIVQEKIPVFNGIRRHPNLRHLMVCSAAGASSGGIEMYHAVGITPEARDLEMAFGSKKPLDTLKFGREERKAAYDRLQSAKSADVDVVVLGCPHYSLSEIWKVACMLEGKKLSGNTALWIFTPCAIKAMADRAGYTQIIERAGGTLLTDCCACVAGIKPAGAKVAASDSPKQAHHMNSILNLPSWFGSMEDCVNAALTGKWKGELV